MISSRKLIGDLLGKIADTKENGIKLSGIPSGFKALDNLIHGLQPGKLIVIAGKPGMGLSVFSKTIALNSALKFKNPVLIFSLDKSAAYYMGQMIHSETTISTDKLARGNVDEDTLNNSMAKIIKLAEAPIFIDDTPFSSFKKFKKQLIKYISITDIKLVVIDCLQLMGYRKVSKSNRDEALSFIVFSLKKLAQQLQLPIVLVSHLPDIGKLKIDSRRPKLSDLSRVNSLVLLSDVILFLYRPEYYGIDEWDDLESASTWGQAELILAKNTDGNICNMRIEFTGHLLKFLEINKITDVNKF